MDETCWKYFGYREFKGTSTLQNFYPAKYVFHNMGSRTLGAFLKVFKVQFQG
ncbi:hypothetical protein [Methanosarcina sp.]|uniref:hypothetical protein n=1 Tax=Methanosarcina sp. TaxID=2213 RepID=UPI002988EBE3|nr:hypothetical protein [Methanosarcina sp.]MDW5550638.1 hypothetical protein [Methanosarcina sp.]MDW5552401.1 hypothetical protein [Methanosarcina sp.]